MALFVEQLRFLQYFLCLNLVSSISACYESDTIYMQAFVGSGPSPATPEACQVACQNHPNCQTFTLNGSGTCYLKGSAVTVGSNPGWTSGPKFCPQ